MLSLLLLALKVIAQGKAISLVASGVLPLGVLTGLAAKQRGYNFGPWFLAGISLPLVSFYMLHQRIEQDRIEKENEEIEHLLLSGAGIKLPPKSTHTQNDRMIRLSNDVADPLFNQLWDESESEENNMIGIKKLDLFVNETHHYSEKRVEHPSFYESDIIDEKQHGPVVNRAADFKPTFYYQDKDTKLKVEASRSYKSSTAKEVEIERSFKHNSSPKFNLLEQKITRFLQGAWIFKEEKQHLIKKMTFNWDKCNVVSNKNQFVIPTSFVQYIVNSKGCFIELNNEVKTVKIEGPNSILIGQERYFRYKKIGR